MSTPQSLGNAPPSWSTVQHSRDATFQGGCHLDNGYCIAASACGSAVVDAQESQYLEPSDDRAVSISEALQLSSYPIVSDPQVLAASPNLVGHLSRESDSVQVALPLGHVAGKNRASSIDSPFVDHTRGYSGMQVHASDYITNHNTALPPSYLSPLPPYAMEQSSGYPRVIGDVSTSGDLDNIFTAPMMGLGPVLSSHDGTAGQVTGPNAPWPWLPNSAAPPPQALRQSDDFAIGNVPLPPNQAPFFNMHHALQYIPGHQSLTSIPSQSNSMSYSTSHGYNWPHPSFPIPNQNSPSLFQQEHLGYPSSVQPHYARPVDPPGFHGGVRELGGRNEGDSHHELSHHGATQYSRQMHRHYSRLQEATRSYSIALDTESKVHGDHPSHTLSDHKTHSFYNRAAYAPGDHTTGGAVDDYGNFDASKVNLEQVVDLPPQLPLPPNQLSLSPPKLHLHDCVSPIGDRSPSRTSHCTDRPATAQSPSSTRPPGASYHNDSTSCGWREDAGDGCSERVNCSNLKEHLISAHGINNTGQNTKIICRWCPSERSKGVLRKNLPRHVKEVHLGCRRGY